MNFLRLPDTSRLLALRGAAALALAVSVLSAPLIAAPAVAAPQPSAHGCQLNSDHRALQHLIEIQFNNVHSTRANPNVPSDLEQMPHRLNFTEANGVMLDTHHTPLISHTANDILTTLTGVYPDRHGVPVANSFRYYLPNGTTHTGVSF